MGVVRRKAVRAISSVPLVRYAIRTQGNVRRPRGPTALRVTPIMTPIARQHLRTIFALASRGKRARNWGISASLPVEPTRRMPVLRGMHVKRWTWMGLSALSVYAIVLFLPWAFKKPFYQNPEITTSMSCCDSICA